MPVITTSSYTARGIWRSAHFQTIIPSLFRRVDDVVYKRERVELPDGDFIDVDRSSVGSKRLGIVLHGLEGNAGRAYVRGMVRALNRTGIDAAAVNFRGCSGEINRLPRFYHSGDTDDVRFLVRRFSSISELYLIGFSMGGNVILKYLGEEGSRVQRNLRRAVVFSVPCHLASSADRLARRTNRIYMRRFLGMLREKIEKKSGRVKGALSADGFESIQNFKDFDDRYTAPLHGFRNAEDYWEQSSSIRFFPAISIPTLMINSLDDPFLAPPCFPVALAQDHPHVTLELPRWGGHVGFVKKGGMYWSEQRAMEFLNSPHPGRSGINPQDTKHVYGS